MKTGFLFSGQGTQYPGMCRELYEKEQTVKNCFEHASDILGYDVAALCFDEYGELNKTAAAQPAIFTVSAAMAKLFKEKTNFRPDFVAGNSVGEFAALATANVLTFEDALKLVKVRAALMDAATAENCGVMYDVKDYSKEKLQEAIDSFKGNGIACISNINGINNNIISGEAETVERIVEHISKDGARTLRLNVSAGFHSPLMAEASRKFRLELEKYTFSEPECPVLSNVTGRPYSSAEEISASLDKQIISTVHWNDTMKFLEKNGCTEVIEFGPKRTLKNLALNNTSMAAYSYDDADDRKFVDGRYDINKMRAIIFGRLLRAAASTRNNNPDASNYRSAVIDNYREIERCYLRIADEKYIPSAKEIEECGKKLLEILSYKKVSGAERVCSELVSEIKSKLLG